MKAGPDTTSGGTAGGNDPAAASVTSPCFELFEGLAAHELIGRYRSGVERIDPRVLDLPDEALDRPFAADSGVGTWSSRALVIHLMDVELLNTMRLRRTIVEDSPVLEPWDEHAFLDSRLSVASPDALLMPAGACLAVLHTLRQTNATVLVQLSDADWNRRAMTPLQGETTFRAMMNYLTWHLEHHAAFLRGKLDALLGPAPRPEPIQAGGCGAGCACVGKADTDG